VTDGTALELLSPKGVKFASQPAQSSNMQKRAAPAKPSARPRSISVGPRRNLEQLTALRLVCEASGESFHYDVPSDAGTLKDLWDRRLMVSCPHCREVHGFLFRTMYVNSVLSGTRLTFDRV
jgi:hypothetical protein